MSNVRRVYYWGFHNNDPKQMFQSSLAINQVLDTPPGELPPFVAYRLNGQPIPLERGGPVRMVVPWAHGFKSVKWLQHIMLTNDYHANDTYALQNNDPESYLKTAAYIDDPEPRSLSAGQAGRDPGDGDGRLARSRAGRILAPARGGHARADRRRRSRLEDRPMASRAPSIRRRPTGAAACRKTSSPSQVWGFGPDGKPKEWPMRFSIALWSVDVCGPEAGRLRVPRPHRRQERLRPARAPPRQPVSPRSGLNAIQCKQFVVM